MNSVVTTFHLLAQQSALRRTSTLSWCGQDWNTSNLVFDLTEKTMYMGCKLARESILNKSDTFANAPLIQCISWKQTYLAWRTLSLKPMHSGFSFSCLRQTQLEHVPKKDTQKSHKQQTAKRNLNRHATCMAQDVSFSKTNNVIIFATDCSGNFFCHMYYWIGYQLILW